MSTSDLHYRLNYLSDVARRAARLMQLGGTPKMKFKNVRRGKAYPHKGYFTIPVWAAQAHQAFAIAYVIHELSHFQRNYWLKKGWTILGHGKQQRRIEAEAAERFGLRLIYPERGCYPRQVRCLESGKILAGRWGSVFVNEDEQQHPSCLI